MTITAYRLKMVSWDQLLHVCRLHLIYFVREDGMFHIFNSDFMQYRLRLLYWSECYSSTSTRSCRLGSMKQDGDVYRQLKSEITAKSVWCWALRILGFKLQQSRHIFRNRSLLFCLVPNSNFPLCIRHASLFPNLKVLRLTKNIVLTVL